MGNNSLTIPIRRRWMNAVPAMFCGLAVSMLAGCASLVASAASGLADNLSSAILNQTDPETVRDGAPAYLLMMDSFVEGAPKNESMLQAASKLYALYGAIFVEDVERAKRLAARSREYGARSMCLRHKPACTWSKLDFEEFDAALLELDEKDVAALFSYSLSWLAYIRAHRDDWIALAQLPKVESAMLRLQDLDDTYEGGSVHLYLAVLSTLRPPALGGEPEKGRMHFERSIELTDGRDLSAKVEFARSYARMLYERELHDQLLNEVLQADPRVDGLTLFNTLAQRQAVDLLASADDYF